MLSIISGCSVTHPVDETLADYRADYKKSTSLPPLEIPPDLISTQIREELVVPEYAASEQHKPINTISSTQSIQFKHDGPMHWLVLPGTSMEIWPKIRTFWLENGFTLAKEAPELGIMETEWAENRADIPQDALRKLLGKLLDTVYSASTRDKFRIRLEQGQIANTTELYLTHKGVEEVSQGERFVWQRRPADPELEAEMLHRIIVFLGVDKQQADTLLATPALPKVQLRAELVQTENEFAIVVHNDLEHTWRRTGLALDRVGFTVQDRNRLEGVYFVRYIDPEQAQKQQGFFSKLFDRQPPADKQTYLIHLAEETSDTRIFLTDQAGHQVMRQTAERILTLLYEQLK